MKEQFPWSKGVVIRDVAVAVGTDMAMVEESLGTFHTGVTILEVHAPLSDGLDLGPLKHDARLELLLNEVVVVGLAIRSDRFFEPVLVFPHSGVTLPLQERGR